jgi:hypothetical protein
MLLKGGPHRHGPRFLCFFDHANRFGRAAVHDEQLERELPIRLLRNQTRDGVAQHRSAIVRAHQNRNIDRRHF